MANTTIQLKFSTVSGNTPPSLSNGELAINTFDGKIFYRDPSNVIKSIQNFPGPSGLNGEVQFNDSGNLGTDSTFTFDSANNILNVESVRVGNVSVYGGNTITLSTTTQTQIFSFNANTYSSAKFIVQATQGSSRQITEMLVLHDGTTAYATEYAIIRTGSNLFNLDVNILSGNVRLMTTGTSATSTTYKVSSNLIGV
jgi:hypothetical protein